MRIFLLLVAIAFGSDAYFYSGHYTKAAVNGISSQVHALTSGGSAKAKREAPQPTTQQGNN